MSATPLTAAGRAAIAERAITRRHLRRFVLYPAGRMGVITHPGPLRHRLFVDYHYWWQAHLLDCLIDAELREPDAARRRVIRRLPEAVRWRNRGSLINAYYDDVAWMALALGRAQAVGIDTGWRRLQIGRYLYEAWREDGPGAGIPWRLRDSFRNVPANGSMAILMARLGRIRRARDTLDWVFRDLFDGSLGLVLEGWRPDGIDGRLFTYNQGLVLGAELELAKAGAAMDRLHALVRAIDERAARGHVINACGGGDGGLFHGITARYLGNVAVELPGSDADAAATRALAARLVRSSADAAWANRAHGVDGPWFGPDWTRPATVPGRDGVAASGGVMSSDPAERDLSVQLSGWMVLEQAARLERVETLHPRPVEHRPW